MEKEVVLNKRKYVVALDDKADLSVFDEVFRDLDYRVLNERIKDAKSLIIDLGAHKGMFCVYTHSLNSNVKIMALEPAELNYSYLKQNLKRNRIKNVFSKKLALDSEIGEKELFISEDSHNHSLVNTSGRIEKIMTITLPELFKRSGADKVDLIKMDIEGAEFPIIQQLEKSDPDFFAKVGCWYIEGHLYQPEFQAQTLQNIFRRHYRNVEFKKSDYDKRMFFLRVF